MGTVQVHGPIVQQQMRSGTDYDIGSIRQGTRWRRMKVQIASGRVAREWRGHDGSPPLPPGMIQPRSRPTHLTEHTHTPPRLQRGKPLTGSGATSSATWRRPPFRPSTHAQWRGALDRINGRTLHSRQAEADTDCRDGDPTLRF